MSKAINNFAIELELPKSEVQILVKPHLNTVVYYQCKNNIPVKQKLFKEILNSALLSALGYEKHAEPFMVNTIKKYAVESNKNVDDVLVYINQWEELYLTVYVEKQHFKTISLSEHFREMEIT